VREGGDLEPSYEAKALSRAPGVALERCFDIGQEFYGRGWMMRFAWPGRLGRHLYDHPGEIARVDLPSLRRLCTTIARAEHMSGGASDTALARGVLVAIVRRLAELRRLGQAP
jgi:Family of unknown function (DUF6508)